MKLALLLDSSNTDLTIAIVCEDKLLYSYSEYAWQRQSEKMIPVLQKALNETGYNLNQFDTIVCGKGPGSYTGVRIAMTIAKTIALMSGAKLILASSLALLGGDNKDFVALMNARSNRSYIGIYSNDNPLLNDQVVNNDEINTLIKEHHAEGFPLCGDLKYLNKESSYDIVQGMMRFINSLEVSDPLSAKPVYLKD